MLVLFDIDGTLVSGATEAHREAMHAALLAVHGIDAQVARRPLSPAGRTDGEIARAILLDAGISAKQIDERAAQVRDECARAYARLREEDLSHTVLPGVTELLDWLYIRDDVQLGLLSGNYEAVARIKLRRAGIGRYFEGGPGAFGSDSEDRAALPMIARRRAGTRGHPQPRRETLVIGDTPRDIACARADDVRCFAVATGPYAVEDLAGADEVSADAHELAALLRRTLEASRG